MMKAKIELEHELKLERRRSRCVNLERYLQELMTHLEGTFYWSHDVTYKKGRKKRRERRFIDGISMFCYGLQLS